MISWAIRWIEAKEVVCGFPYRGPIGFQCSIGPTGKIVIPPGASGVNNVDTATLRAEAVKIAHQDYADYSRIFLYPSNSLMVKSGLWIELEAIIGFIVGLGLGSLMGQRTVPVVLMIVLEIVLTPILSQAVIPHLINVQRAVVGIATAHLEPANLRQAFGGGGGAASSVHESTMVAWAVIVAWLVAWSAVGAWRMSTRDA